jgi:hypothetical protein
VGEQGGTGGLHEVATPANDFGIGLRFFDFANHDRGVLIATGFPGKEKELFRHQKWGLESFGDAYQSDGGHNHGANHPAAGPKNVFILFHQKEENSHIGNYAYLKCGIVCLAQAFDGLEKIYGLDSLKMCNGHAHQKGYNQGCYDSNQNVSNVGFQGLIIHEFVDSIG